MAKAPAFQFYPMDFMQGAKYLTLAERGAYISLLCEQWDLGSLSNAPSDLARVLGCSPKQAAKLWEGPVGKKFALGADGRYRNPRLELEREKQERYRAAQSERGKQGGRPQKAVVKPTVIKIESVGLTEPKPSQSPRGQSPLSSSLSSSSEIHVPPDLTKTYPSAVPRHPSSSALVMGPAEYDRLSRSNSFVGSRLQVPHVLHGEFRRKLGGSDPDARLLAWYLDVNTEVEMDGTPIPDVFKFLRPKFEVWASEFAADAELEKFRPKGA